MEFLYPRKTVAEEVAKGETSLSTEFHSARAHVYYGHINLNDFQYTCIRTRALAYASFAIHVGDGGDTSISAINDVPRAMDFASVSFVSRILYFKSYISMISLKIHGKKSRSERSDEAWLKRG